MGVEEIIEIINKKIKDAAPILSREYGMSWTDESFELISETVTEILQADRVSIESFAKKEGVSVCELENATQEILREMFVQAMKNGRKEVLPEDFRLALTTLQWHIFPFCKSGERSGGIGIRGP